jgi:hypothetical protein
MVGEVSGWVTEYQEDWLAASEDHSIRMDGSIDYFRCVVTTQVLLGQIGEGEVEKWCWDWGCCEAGKEG